MALSDEQREKYAQVGYEAFQTWWNDQPGIMEFLECPWNEAHDVVRRDYYPISAAVAEAARRDLLLQIAQDLHGWAVINPGGNTHWPMTNVLLKYDRNYLPAASEQDEKDTTT